MNFIISIDFISIWYRVLLLVAIIFIYIRQFFGNKISYSPKNKYNTNNTNITQYISLTNVFEITNIWASGNKLKNPDNPHKQWIIGIYFCSLSAF